MTIDQDLPAVDIGDAMRAIENWKQAELGWHALRQFNDDRRIEPAPEWEGNLDQLRPILKRSYDPVRRFPGTLRKRIS